MSARSVLSALRALSLSALALCAVGTCAADPTQVRADGRKRGSTWLRLVIASVAACAALFALARTAVAGEPITRAALEDEALALSACSLEPGLASFWSVSAPVDADQVEADPTARTPNEASAGCTGLLDDPLAPAPLCDPSATTGVAAAYVRSVADDRLEAGPGCGNDELGAHAWLGEHDPDPASWQQSSLEPAHLSELAAVRAPAAFVSLVESPYPGHCADGISIHIERPPMRS